MAGKILIVSYSYTGNTHRIASAIRELTGGDWCEIYPSQPYPMEFQKRLDQARREVSRGYLPNLLPGAIHPGQYSEIFVGSPIWCGTIAPPMAAYLSKFSFSGKGIYPFISHCGTDELGQRPLADIRRLCRGARIKDCFYTVEDGGEILIKDLSRWLAAKGPDTCQITA